MKPYKNIKFSVSSIVATFVRVYKHLALWSILYGSCPCVTCRVVSDDHMHSATVLCNALFEYCWGQAVWSAYIRVLLLYRERHMTLLLGRKKLIQQGED